MRHNVKNLNDYIVVLKNILSEELCDSIVNKFKNSNEWAEATIKNEIIDKNTRNCTTIPLHSYKELDNSIFKAASKCITEYNKRFPLCVIEEDSGYTLLKYEQGGFYTEHTDSFKRIPRAVSCSFILNDDYKGGEFSFFNKELIYKLNKGDVLMFPSNFMYPHEVMPVIKGTRYSIITWFI